MKTRPLTALLVSLLLPIVGLSARAQTNATDPAAVMQLKRVTLTIGNATLDTEIAATPEEGERGLMFRTKLADNAGMIFVLPLGHANFWMKNTLIPLSVAFVDKNGVILEIHDMKPLDETVTHSDSDQVAYAVEANLHWFALNGIKAGDKITPPPATLMTSTH